MVIWFVRGFALISVIALIIGMAAEFTTTIGCVNKDPIIHASLLQSISRGRDLKSVSSSVPFSNSLGLMLAKGSNAAAAARQKKPTAPACQAYKKGTDFPQRPGAIFIACGYHLLTRQLAFLFHLGRTDTILSFSRPTPRYACPASIARRHAPVPRLHLSLRPRSLRQDGPVRLWISHDLHRNPNPQLFVSGA